MAGSQGSTDERYINRELSWLDFNARVLALAEDTFSPLLERVKFLAIFASNLDEFFMVRVAGLKRQVAAGVITRSPDGLTPREQLEAIAASVGPLVERHARLFSEDILPALSKADVHVMRWKDLDDPQREELNELFQRQIFPVVTPLAVDPAHPFPYISNLSVNLAVSGSRPGFQRSAIRTRQGAAPSATLRCTLDRDRLRPVGGRDRGQPRSVVPGDACGREGTCSASRETQTWKWMTTAPRTSSKRSRRNCGREGSAPRYVWR